jgi:PPOX class probable F420-dependent enzyme
VSPDTAWRLLISQPVAVLATINADGTPHLVPFTFAAVGERRLVSAVDEKPKRSRSLRRLDNIERDGRVTILAHHYEENWEELWWVRASGHAALSAVPATDARRALRDRYPAYEEQALSPWLTIDVAGVTGWSARPDPGQARNRI